MNKVMEKITALREKKGWSKIKLLKEVNLRTSQSYFWNMEAGFFFPSPRFTIRAAKALETDPEKLYNLVIKEKLENLEKQLRENFAQELAHENKKK